MATAEGTLLHVAVSDDGDDVCVSSAIVPHAANERLAIIRYPDLHAERVHPQGHPNQAEKLGY